jgi:hypothetical protein
MLVLTFSSVAVLEDAIPELGELDMLDGLDMADADLVALLEVFVVVLLPHAASRRAGAASAAGAHLR